MLCECRWPWGWFLILRGTSHLSLTDCEAGQVWPVSALETPPLISLHFIFIRQIAPPLPQIPCPLSTDTGSLGSGGRHLVGHPPHFSPEFTFTRMTKRLYDYCYSTVQYLSITWRVWLVPNLRTKQLLLGYFYLTSTLQYYHGCLLSLLHESFHEDLKSNFSLVKYFVCFFVFIYLSGYWVYFKLGLQVILWVLLCFDNSSISLVFNLTLLTLIIYCSHFKVKFGNILFNILLILIS